MVLSRGFVSNVAGHNERRRKPHVGFVSSRGRSFHSYTGSNFQGFTTASTSFICQDLILRGNAPAEKNGTHDWVKNIKFKDETGYDQKQTYNCINGQLLFEKQSSLIDKTDNTGPQITFSENACQCSPDLVLHSLFHTNSPRSKDLAHLGAASTIQELPGISESGCALSLLSSQTRNSSGYSSATPRGHTLPIPSISPHCSVNEISDILFGVGEKALSSEVENKNPFIWINSVGRNQPSSMLVLNSGCFTHSGFGNEINHSSKFMNIKDHLLFENGTTIDLLQ